MEKKIGHYSFVLGVILAVLLGIAASSLGAATVWLTSLLVVLGLIVGLLNVGGREAKDFLAIATMLVIVLWAGGTATGGIGLEKIQWIGPWLAGVVQYSMAFIVPAVLVVALKGIWGLAQVGEMMPSIGRGKRR
ncbi:hypothetical protein HYV81_06100 [Candidatus Woesearchaeota archaeon]|nr:hypothetical protein [Candidatus Woesearchaeota archaeon]